MDLFAGSFLHGSFPGEDQAGPQPCLLKAESQTFVRSSEQLTCLLALSTNRHVCARERANQRA